MEGLLLFVGAMFFVLTLVIYAKRDDSEGVKAFSMSNETKDLVSVIESNQKQIKEELKVTAISQEAIMSDLQKRIDVLEKAPKAISVKLEGVDVNIVEKAKMTVLPPPPVGLDKKSKLPLSKRAGLLRDN